MDFTSRLRLRKPDGSDPFLRDDFLANWDLIDQVPGIYPCTSDTRPSGWGGANLGRLIFETDTRRLLAWNNPGWVQPQDAPQATTGSLNPNQRLGRNAKATYTAGTFTIIRPGKIIMIGIMRVGIDSGRTQSCWIDPWINGSDASVGPGAFVRQNDNGTNQTGENSQPVPVLGIRSVNPGTFNLQMHIQVGDFTTGVTVGTIQMMAFLGS